MPDVESSDRFLVWAGDGFARDTRSADHPNLQRWCPMICFWSGFIHFQWLCCSTFAPNSCISPQNRLYIRAIYHFFARSGKLAQGSDKSAPIIGNQAESSGKAETM